jgi:hypothetical protein
VVWAVSLSTTKLSPRRLTHPVPLDGIRSLSGVGNQHLAPSPSSALPPSDIRVAAPQCISGRTSYLHVRLEFLLYPHVIPQFCNTGEFEPRRTFTSASLCTWIAHVVSGRIAATLFLLALFRLGFPSAPELCRSLTRNVDALAGSFYKRHAISPWFLLGTVASDCW